VLPVLLKKIINQKKKIMNAKMKWMMALKIWMVIYPSITLFLYLFGQPLSLLPLYLRTLLLTLTLVPWMVFVGVPFVDTIFERMASKNSSSH
jgi:antibiotic biosynthesis monooxygenase (ABM) superfamily enzyme